MISAGTHRAVVGEGMLGKTGTGKEQVAVSLEVLDSVTDASEQMAWYGYFTDAAAEYTIKALRTMGWTGDDLADLSSIKGAEVAVVVEHEEYEGKTRAKVRWINPVGSGSGAILKEQMSEAEAKSFAAKMKGRIRAFDKLAGQPKNTGKPNSRTGALSPEPPPIGADDLPF
jgi:hypothetical protein